MKEKEKKLIVILSGGGAKTAFQVGAWNTILNQGIDLSGSHQKLTYPHAVFGVSGGAINGAMMAMGKNKELFKFWNLVAGKPEEVFTSEFLKIENGKTVFDAEAVIRYGFENSSALQKAGLLFKKTRTKAMQSVSERILSLSGLADNSPLFNKLKSLVRLKDVKSAHFQAGYVSLTDGNYYSPSHHEYESDEAFQNAVLASTSIPGVFSPVQGVKNQSFEVTRLIDGGIRNVTPLGDAVRFIENSEQEDDYHFVIINCHSPQLRTVSKDPNLLQIITRGIYDIALDEIRDTDLKEFLRINHLVKQATQKGIELFNQSGRKLRAFKVKIIEPARELPFALDFSRSSVMDSFTHGFQRAAHVLTVPNWE